MRLAPALGTCWLAMVAVLAGCGTWTAIPKADQVLSAKAPSATEFTDAGRAISTPGRPRKPQVHVPHIEESETRGRQSGAGEPGQRASAQIAREMAEMRAEWEVRCREMRAVCPPPPVRPETGQQASGSKSEDMRVTDQMLAVERKYAPQYLNCRIRIRLLESRLTDAGGPARDSLLRKLEQAKAELAAVDKACAQEMGIARLDVAPAVGKEDVASPKQNIGKTSEAGATGGHAETDSHPDQKAGGGID